MHRASIHRSPALSGPAHIPRYARIDARGHLTEGTQRAYYECMGYALCAARFSERKPFMKTLLRALNCASKKHDQLHSADSGGTSQTEVGARQEQHRNGGVVWRLDGTPVAQVHIIDRAARHGDAYALLRGGSIRTRSRSNGASFCKDACNRRDRRDRQAVIDAGHAPATLPQNLTSFVNRALHDASLASTPNAAIDLLADALLALAVLVHPVEVPHG